MTMNLIERKAQSAAAVGWTALGGALMLVAGFVTYWGLSSPVTTDLLMGYDYDPSARTGLRVGAGFAVIAWLASFITSVLGMRRSTPGRIILSWLVILALVLIGPVLLFCAAIAFTS